MSDSFNISAQETSGLFVSYPQLQKLLKIGLDLIFPPRCAGCDRVDTIWCTTCQEELDTIPIASNIRQLPDMQVASTGEHSGKLQQAVIALKYDNIPSLRIPLGQRLVTSVQQLTWIFDMVIPVPLYTARLRKRGYNQAELLSAVVADQLSVKHRPNAILRFRETQSQVGLNQAQREENVQNAFQANPDIVQDQSILLIDDVLTTGSTLHACTLAVLAAGAKNVCGLTVTSARDSSILI